jgi:hypothetical protein
LATPEQAPGKRQASTDGSDARPRRAPYEPPRIMTDEAFEQISLACTTKMGTKKNFT